MKKARKNDESTNHGDMNHGHIMEILIFVFKHIYPAIFLLFFEGEVGSGGFLDIIHRYVFCLAKRSPC